jgi:hypothetical protein
VPDVVVNASGHELGGLFEGQQLPLALPLPHGFPVRPQRAYAEDQRDETGQQQNPRDDLMRRSRRQEPDIQPQQDQRQNELPGKEAKETVRTRLE